MSEPTYYVVMVSMPGYMPNTEPIVISDDCAPVEVLSYILTEVEWMMPEPEFKSENSTEFDEETDRWDAIYSEVANDLEHADRFDHLAGFAYRLPDGNVISADPHTRDSLIELGYKPGEDFEE